MDSIDLSSKKLSVMEIFILSFGVFKSNVKSIVPFCCVIYIPITILLSVLFPNMYATVNDLSSGSPEEVSAFLFNVLLVMGISLIYTPLLAAFSTHIADTRFSSNTVCFESIMESTFVKWGWLFVTALMYAAISYFSFFMLLIPGIYFAISFNLYSGVIVTDKLWGLKALIQSQRYIRGRWFGYLAFTLLLMILKYFFTFLLESVFGLIVPFGGILPSVVINTVIGTFSAYFDINNAIWYLNQRALKLKSEPELLPNSPS